APADTHRSRVPSPRGDGPFFLTFRTVRAYPPAGARPARRSWVQSGMGPALACRFSPACLHTKSKFAQGSNRTHVAYVASIRCTSPSERTIVAPTGPKCPANTKTLREKSGHQAHEPLWTDTFHTRPGHANQTGPQGHHVRKVTRGPLGRGSDPTCSGVISAQTLGQVFVQCGEELLGGEPILFAADQQRQVLGHLTALDGLDDDVLERVGELDDLRGVVQLAPVLQTTGPGKDGRDRVGRGGFALLVPAVVPGDGAVRGLGLDGPTIGGAQHRGHQAERTEALGDGVRLHVTVVVLGGPDIATLPLERRGDHVVDEAMLVGK